MSDDTLRDLERHVAQLGERFDSVRIVATTHEDGETIIHSLGAGNFCAQTGAVREWLMVKDEEIRETARNRNDD